VPAWEGGHRDHDAVHLIGVAFAIGAALLPATRQFPLYRGGPETFGFSLMNRLPQNGAVERIPIPRAARLRHLRLVLGYRTQWLVWVWLLPQLAWFYWRRGEQQTQAVSIARLRERPHPGPLLYERYGDVTHEAFCEQADGFLRSHIAVANDAR
jgi:hypothetical protein